MELMNYDHNMVSSGRLAKQTVRLTFGMWQYRKDIEVVVGGNCKGFSVIDSAIDTALEGLYGDNDYASIVLEHPTEGSLECEDEEGRHDEWLKDLLIGAQIVAIEADGSLADKYPAAFATAD